MSDYRDMLSRHRDTAVFQCRSFQAEILFNIENLLLAPSLYITVCEPDCYQKRFKPSQCEGTFFGQGKATL